MRIPALVVLVSCAHAAAFTPGDQSAIRGVLDAQVAAWNKGDLAAYMDGYAHSDQLVFTSGGNIRTGWQTAFDHYQERYAKDKTAMGKLAFEVVSIDPVGADGAVVLGKWNLTGSPHDGHGVFSLVMARRAEGWRIIHDHTSVGP